MCLQGQNNFCLEELSDQIAFSALMETIAFKGYKTRFSRYL